MEDSNLNYRPHRQKAATKKSREADSRARRVSQWIPKIPLRIWSALHWCRESRRFNYCGTLRVLDPLPTSYHGNHKLSLKFDGRVLWVNLLVNECDGLFQEGRLGWLRSLGWHRMFSLARRHIATSQTHSNWLLSIQVLNVQLLSSNSLKEKNRVMFLAFPLLHFTIITHLLLLDKL